MPTMGTEDHRAIRLLTSRLKVLIDFIKQSLVAIHTKGMFEGIKSPDPWLYGIKEQHPNECGSHYQPEHSLAGVPINEEQEIKLTPLTFISPHYVQTHYGQGQIPANDSEDEEAGQQAENADMGDPNPMPAQPQIPQQFNMQQFITRQEEFMRRSDEINWYVGTSTYQQNQAALGFTPHFPPPPPWLQDPQYIPDYYRPHFPPPPDDADQ
nr:hypothetical protein Iba_chr03aCG1320 [Ipomoea batatas]